MKKRIASLALATVIAVSGVPAVAASYPNDIDYSRYEEAIKKSYDFGAMNGYPDGSFKPAETMTRSEFATMVARWKDLELDKNASFEDTKTHWATKYIAAIEKKGWMKGKGDGNFYPDEKISYMEALTVIIRASEKEDEAEDFGGYPLGYEYTADRYKITENISGSLQSPIYRGAIAQLLVNSVEKIGTEDDDKDEDDSVDKLGVVKSGKFLKNASISVEKDIELSSAVKQLPGELYVTLTSGKSIFLKVNWNYEKTNYNQKASGTYYIKGSVELPAGVEDPKNIIKEVEGRIEVKQTKEELENQKILNRVSPLSQTEYRIDLGTTAEEALKKLPSDIGLSFIGGGKAVADIKWVLELNYNKEVPGEYKATGVVVLPDDVVDTQGILKNLEAKIIVREEADEIKINKVEMIDAYNYRVRLSRKLEIILDSGAGNLEIKSGNTPVGINKVSYENGDERTLVVNTKEALEKSGSYSFSVKDLKNGEQGTLIYSPKEDEKENTGIASVVVTSHDLPAGEESLISMKAYNAKGQNITDSVRGEIKVRRTDEPTEKTAADKIELGHGETQFVEIEYLNNEEKKEVKINIRIRGANRRIVGIEDWTFGTSDPSKVDWDSTVKILQKNSDRKYIYIKPIDQFGEVDKVKWTNWQDMALTSSREDFATIGTKEGPTLGAKVSENPIYQITHTSNGEGRFSFVFKEDGKSYPSTILPGNFKAVAESEPKTLELEGSILNMSSSESLLDKDITQTVKVRIKDEEELYINPAGAGISAEVTSGKDFLAGLNSEDKISLKAGTLDTFDIVVKRGTIDEGEAKEVSIKFSYGTLEKTVTFDINAPYSAEQMVVEGLEKSPGEEMPELVLDGNPSERTIKVYQTDIKGIKVKRVTDEVKVEIRDMADGPDSDPVFEGAGDTNNGEVTINASSAPKLKKNSINIVTVIVGDVVVKTETLVVR